MRVYIRPLIVTDAITSVNWRNNHRIWRYTGSSPRENITLDDEIKWIKCVLLRADEIRFAICVGESMRYIGNVQLTDISEYTAQFHIFIGELKYHGKGIGQRATNLMLDYAQNVLGLKQLYLHVNCENRPAIFVYKKCGFHIHNSSSTSIEMIKIF